MSRFGFVYSSPSSLGGITNKLREKNELNDVNEGGDDLQEEDTNSD